LTLREALLAGFVVTALVVLFGGVAFGYVLAVERQRPAPSPCSPAGS
jgi:hypothetical protein